MSYAKSLLMVSYIFPPLGGPASQRSLKFCKYLPQFGIKPIVVSVDPKFSLHAKDPSLCEEIPSEAVVERILFRENYPVLEKISFNKISMRTGVSQLVRFLSFPDLHYNRIFFLFYKKCVRLVKELKPDAVFTTSAPYTSHFVGYFLKKKFNIPWIADYRDPWYSNTIEEKSYGILGGMHKKIAGISEKFLHRYADKIVVVTECHRDIIVNRLKIDPQKIFVINNGYDEADFAGDFAPRNLPAADSKEKVIITYVGSLYGDYPQMLANFCGDLQRRFGERILVRFIGKSSDLMKKFSLKNADLIPYLPHEKLIESLSRSDFLLVMTEPDCDWAIPGKTYEYMRSGIPILALTPAGGALGNIIEETGTGFLLPFEGGAAALAKIMEQKTGDFHPNLNNIKRYSRQNLTSHLAEVVNSLKISTPH